MKKNKSAKEIMLSVHRDVVSNTREALNFLTKELALNTCDEQKFLELAGQSGVAALTLQRISSALSGLISLEQKLLERQIEIDKRAAKNNNITRHDCEIVISLVRGWGLLRDNCDDEIEKIIDNYENNKGAYQ